MGLSNAERQAKHRLKEKVTFQNVDRLLDEITHALDRGRCGRLADNLPEERQARIRELTRRFMVSRLIATKLEKGTVAEILNTIDLDLGDPTWKRKKEA